VIDDDVGTSTRASARECTLARATSITDDVGKTMANEDLTTEVRARDVRTNDGGGRDREFRERFRSAFASIANEGFAIAIETRDRDRSDWIGLDWIRSSYRMS